MLSSSVVACVKPILALALSAASPSPPSEASPPQTVQDVAPYEEQLEHDIEIVLTDSTKAYLHARARLTAHADLAAPALWRHLEAVPAPGPAERKRLLEVLAEIGRSQDLPAIAAEVQRAIKRAGDDAATLSAATRWGHLLVDQREAAMPYLGKLIGDRELPDEVRVFFLRALVEVTPPSRMGELVALVGRGKQTLRTELVRALSTRTARQRKARKAVAAATDVALRKALQAPADPNELSRLPALLRFRARITPKANAETTALLTSVAADENADFSARVAALRGLPSVPAPTTPAFLLKIASEQLSGAKRDTQRGEILGWIALSELEAESAGALVTELALVEDDAPRLAVLGFKLATLDPNHAWLEAAIANPWPQVRQAALARVQGPCEQDTYQRLAKAGGASDQGGDKDRAVARSAIAALGRCGGEPARKRLTRVMRNQRMDSELRAEAARQLVKHGGLAGAQTVARELNSTAQEPAFARRLAAALRYAPESSPLIDNALCDQLRSTGAVGQAARKSLTTLHPKGMHCTSTGP